MANTTGRLPRYDRHTTKQEALDLLRGVIPTGSEVCLRCQWLAARAILDDRWKTVGPAARNEAENIYFERVDNPPRKHTC